MRSIREIALCLAYSAWATVLVTILLGLAASAIYLVVMFVRVVL